VPRIQAPGGGGVSLPASISAPRCRDPAYPSLMARRPLSCPTCGTRMIPILYGLPSPEMRESVERGEIKLGGCVVSGGDPEWWCPQCEEPWPARQSPAQP